MSSRYASAKKYELALTVHQFNELTRLLKNEVNAVVEDKELSTVQKVVINSELGQILSQLKPENGVRLTNAAYLKMMGMVTPE